ncbi:MAG: class I SAM-dependent methyltransferase [Pseudomonadota bacterium]
MSFSADWLALRRPADAAARNPEVAGALATHFSKAAQVRVLDLGAGTGSNMRLTSAHLPQDQSWTLVDSDVALLSQVVDDRCVETRIADLAVDLPSLVGEETDLVTCSALLDLCGSAWLDQLSDLLARYRLPIYAVLSYDGTEKWEPLHPEDRAVQDAFLADQGLDKGLGPSLGPNAHAYFAERLRQSGFSVIEGRSDWDLTPTESAELITALAEGTGAVADSPTWTDARRSATRALIGHLDLFAVPPTR